jgi:hypothetical protein
MPGDLTLRHQDLVASIEDLLATKLKAIMDRAEAMSNDIRNWSGGDMKNWSTCVMD